MKTYRELMSEALQGDGDCYETAGKIILDMHPLSKKLKIAECKLVHALVMGQGDLTGYRFGHAWILHKNKVYDFSNGNEIIMDAGLYYAIGQVEKKKGFYAEYEPNAARMKVLMKEHWGHWDLDQSKEGMISEAKTKRSDDVLPDSKREIGRTRKKVAANILKQIKVA